MARGVIQQFCFAWYGKHLKLRKAEGGKMKLGI